MFGDSVHGVHGVEDGDEHGRDDPQRAEAVGRVRGTTDRETVPDVARVSAHPPNDATGSTERGQLFNYYCLNRTTVRPTERHGQWM